MKKFKILMVTMLLLLAGLIFGNTQSQATTSDELSYYGGLFVIFDSNYYSNSYEDLAAAFGNDYIQLLNHYATYGISEGRQASPVFNIDEYLMINGDVNDFFERRPRVSSFPFLDIWNK